MITDESLGLPTPAGMVFSRMAGPVFGGASLGWLLAPKRRAKAGIMIGAALGAAFALLSTGAIKLPTPTPAPAPEDSF